MSTPFRGVPPRLLQRMRDNKAGRFHASAKTGDSTRIGNQNDPFDDRRTVVFASSSIVAFPQKLRPGSVHYDSSLDPTGQFASVTGSVRAGISDSLITQSSAVETLGPYIEDQVPEQNQSSYFWMTGTDPVITGPGFSSRLASKTTIRLRLPVTGAYQMLASTASMIYYNETAGAFDLAGEGTSEAVMNPGDLGLPHVVNANGTTYEHIGILNTGGSDARLFGPFGNSVVTGTRMLGGATFGDISLINVGNGVMNTLLSTIGPDAALINENFAASADQQITLNQIQQPFLLEKIHVRLPIQAGQTWFEDFTQAEFLALSYEENFDVTGVIADVGGPGVTFALQRQDADNKRELIASASIIPTGDNVSVLNAMTHLEDVGIVQTSDAPDPGAAHTMPAGFLSFGTPGAIVVPDSNSQFTGSVELKMAAAVSNGVVSSHAQTGIVAVAGVPVNPYTVSNFKNSLVLGINPFGRGMDLRPSGRSYMGKEFTAPDYSSNLVSPYNDTIDPSFDVFAIEQNATSPYLLLPGDKLVLSISKYRPVRDQHATSSMLLHSSSDFDLGQLSGSHDFAIGAGNIELTLYGSLIQEAEEFHFGPNQPLTSLVAHENFIASSLPLDQFDVEVPVVFSGSYIDDNITGTLGYVNNAIVNTRGVAFSSVSSSTPFGLPKTGSSLFRNIRLATSNERYYDTLLPPAGQINSTDGGETWNQNDKPFNYIHIGIVDGPGGTTPNNKWQQAFPFEPRYQGIVRQKNPGSDTLASVIVNTGPPTITPGVNVIKQDFALSKYLGDVPQGYPGPSYLLWNKPGGSLVGAANYVGDEIAIKSFYGFGDGTDFNTGYRDSSPRVTGYNFLSGTDLTNYYNQAYNVEIRGWKYGIKNGFAQNSSMVFRRDRYGQFRDMLEQRQFTRFAGNKLEQGPVNVRFTLPDPTDTESSNVSQHATSSLPYFDGISRNRVEIPSYDLVQVVIPEPPENEPGGNNFILPIATP